jgi:hypothetical protein
MRWKGRWLSPTTGLYDVRARQWAPGIGAFTAIDEFGAMAPAVDEEPRTPSFGGTVLSGLELPFGSEEWVRRRSGFGFHDPRMSLWAWPAQNPVQLTDPTGRHDIGCDQKKDSQSACKCRCDHDFQHEIEACCQTWGCNPFLPERQELKNCKADKRRNKLDCKCKCDPKFCVEDPRIACK